MTNIIMLIVAAVLLATDFLIQHFYQAKNGTSARAGLRFNSLLGLFTALIFFVICGFRPTFSLYSLLMASLMALLGITYVIIGFRVMKLGGMATYTLFLMSGGMCIPYLVGLLLLHEEFNPYQMAGLILILIALILSNSGKTALTGELLLLCLIVFFLNGGVSVISKLHQIETVHPTVSTSAFVMLSGVAKFILSGAALVLTGRGKEAATQPSEKAPKGSLGVTLSLIALSALIGGVSYLLQLIGAKNLPATIVYPFITGGSIVLTALFGKLILHEKIPLRKWIGIGICLVGTCLFV